MQNISNFEKKIRNSMRRRILRWLIVVVGLSCVISMGLTAGIVGAYYYASPSLPAAETIRDIQLEVPLRIFSRDGYLISEIGERRRIPITYEDVPQHVVDAFVAAEDQRFFVHPGIDYRGVLRALSQLVLTGQISGGGSTLTQQLARAYFLSLEQSFIRKLREAFLAYKIEQEFDKDQIMAFFLNKMFFGQRAYGVAAASQVYFNKNLSDINIAEAATLAGLLPAPSDYNPVTSSDKATTRRSYVLSRMESLGYISEAEHDQANDFPMASLLHGAAIELNAPYVAEMVRREMLDRFGFDAYTDGYKVITTLDSRLQEAANYSLRNGLLEYTRRRGYRGPISNLELSEETLAAPFDDWPVEVTQVLRQYVPGGLSVAVVTAVNEDNSVEIVLADGEPDLIPWHGIKWAKPFVDRQHNIARDAEPEFAADILSVSDVIVIMPTTAGTWALAQIPEAQGAVVSLDPFDGAVTSLTGGFDFATSKFNRASQAFRQPGSSFKPFIFSAALEHGATAATVILDAPVVISSEALEAVWRPTEYSGRFYGPTRLREALVRSMNLVSVRLLLFQIGIGNATRHIAKFGFGDAALPRNGSLALGAGSASPLDMAQGYAVFANGGFGVKPYVVGAIYGADGGERYRADPAVVCPECFAEPDEGFVPQPNLEDELLLEQFVQVSMENRPDAATAPELFEIVNAAPRVITAQNAFLIQDMMRDVIRRGTGRRARVLERRDLSGKTGTSNDFRDAWFGGFNADLTSVVWVGYDDDLPLGPGEEGSRTALPIWIEFMRIALRGAPEHQMEMPDGIINQRINRKTGCPARAGEPNAIFEMFREGHVPTCENGGDAVDPFNDPTGIDEPETEEDDILF
jgi:penicillin-binding protein 1A